MKKLITILIPILVITSCSKELAYQPKTSTAPVITSSNRNQFIENDSALLRPKEGYSLTKRTASEIQNLEQLSRKTHPVKGGGGGTIPTIADLSAAPLSAYAIRITWSNQSSASSYKVYRDNAGAAIATVAGGWSINPYFDDRGLASASTHSYQVSVVINGVEGTKSNVATATTFTAPTNTGAKVIYLDFDGYTFPANNHWGVAAGTVLDSSGMTSDEKATSLSLAQSYYQLFSNDIIVTDDVNTFNTADPFNRIRVVMTTSWEWYGQVGGVGFIGSFTWGDDAACFVFTSLLYYNTQYCAVAAAHEAGHSLNLYHQSLWDANCNLVEAYNFFDGQPDAPIMGDAYGKNPIWIYGTTSQGCQVYQNDSMVVKSTIRWVN